MADVARGVVLKIDTVAIGKITSLSGPSITAAAIDTTDLDATAKTFLAGPYDPGEITIELMFEPDDTRHAELFADIKAGTESVYKLQWTDGGSTIYTVDGIVTGFTPGAAVDGALTCSVTIKLSDVFT